MEGDENLHSLVPAGQNRQYRLKQCSGLIPCVQIKRGEEVLNWSGSSCHNAKSGDVSISEEEQLHPFLFPSW